MRSLLDGGSRIRARLCSHRDIAWMVRSHSTFSTANPSPPWVRSLAVTATTCHEPSPSPSTSSFLGASSRFNLQPCFSVLSDLRLKFSPFGVRDPFLFTQGTQLSHLKVFARVLSSAGCSLSLRRRYGRCIAVVLCDPLGLSRSDW